MRFCICLCRCRCRRCRRCRLNTTTTFDHNPHSHAEAQNANTHFSNTSQSISNLIIPYGALNDIEQEILTRNMQQTRKKNKKPSAGSSAVSVDLGGTSKPAVNELAATSSSSSSSTSSNINSTTKSAKKPNRKKGPTNATPNGTETVADVAHGQTATVAGPAKPSQSNVGETATPADIALTAQQRSKPAKKINKTSELLQNMSNTSVNKKLDDVLHTVRQLDNTCDFARCKVKTSLIYQDCKLCDQRFCMKHQLPEVHGCGGAARKTERTEFLKPRTIPISAALRRNEQKDAHARLEQKLKELSLARQKVRK